MQKPLTDILDVYDNKKGKLIARISLNGYNIQAGGVFPTSGAMRSFVLLDGDLWEQWNAVESVTLKSELGEQVPVRVAALPVEDDGYGLLEFL
jgi:hypothetical protein